MIKSMTGYARSTSLFQPANQQSSIQLTVELRSVNHRFCELALKAPKGFLFFEERLKRIILERIRRGRVEVFIHFDVEKLRRKKLKVDLPLAQAYLAATRQLKEELTLEGELSISDLLQVEDLFQLEEEETDLEQIWGLLEQTVRDATVQLYSMRQMEGRALARDIESQLAKIKCSLEQLHKLAPQAKEEYGQRLEFKIREFLEPLGQIDESRLLTELAITAEKTDLNEELIRLASHCQQFADILETEGAVGRKLDFLVQEMNREVNTLGSKANHISMSQLVVELKSSIEKIKEQVQNIE